MAIFKPEMPSSGSSSSFTGICEFGLVEFEDKSGQFDWADLFLEVKVRQKGQGYASSVGLEFAIADDFAKQLYDANKELYPPEPDITDKERRKLKV